MSKINFIPILFALLLLSATPLVSAAESDEDVVRVLYVYSSDLYQFSNTTVNGTQFVVDKVFGYNMSGTPAWTVPSDEFLALAEGDFEGYDVVFIDMVNFYQEMFASGYAAAYDRGCLLIAVRTKPWDAPDCLMPDFFAIRDEKEFSPQNDFTDSFFAIHDKSDQTDKMTRLLVDTVSLKKYPRVSYVSDAGPAPAAQPIPFDGRVTLSEERLFADGVVFCGWTDGQSLFLPGATYTFDGSVTLNAIWEPFRFIPRENFEDVKELCTALVNGEEAPDYYDMNQDGTIDGRDVILLTSYLAWAARPIVVSDNNVGISPNADTAYIPITNSRTFSPSKLDRTVNSYLRIRNTDTKLSSKFLIHSPQGLFEDFRLNPNYDMYVHFLNPGTYTFELYSFDATQETGILTPFSEPVPVLTVTVPQVAKSIVVSDNNVGISPNSDTAYIPITNSRTFSPSKLDRTVNSYLRIRNTDTKLSSKFLIHSPQGLFEDFRLNPNYDMYVHFLNPGTYTFELYSFDATQETGILTPFSEPVPVLTV